MKPAGAVPLEQLNSALAGARRVRAEWLLSMNAGVLSLADLVSHADTDAGVALRAIHLMEILQTQPKWGRQRSKVAMEALRRRCEVADSTPNRRLTVGWLIDHRTSGQRVTALGDQLTSGNRSAPSAGFPYTPVGGL
jgi:hypothetical protein